MASVNAKLAEILGGIRRPGDFFASGEMDIFPPRITVEGAGVVALPLLPVQAPALIAVADQAPYGRGEDTIIDTAVRRTWQIAPSRVRIEGRHWASTLNTILEKVAESFGVTGPIAAELYKMLLYDEGGFFVSHRDTEKEPGMFATLVIVLPSLSTGGALVARHKGREVTFDPRCEEPSRIAYAAFYADCVHEVLPVTSGCRMVLVYNLKRKERGALPRPPDYGDEQTRAAACLRDWADAPRGETAREDTAASGPDDNDDEKDRDDEDRDDEDGDDEDGDDEDGDDEDGDDEDGDDEDGDANDANANDGGAHGPPEKLIYLLEHAYTPAELSFATLKGADAGVAEAVLGAALQAGCDLHLALLSVEESGSAEYTGDYGRGRRGWSRGHEDGEDDSANFEVMEVTSHDVTLTEWRRPDAAPPAFETLPVHAGELVPKGILETLEPDEEHFQEATGNEGASFERTYSRAALVVWPKARVMAVLAQGGLAASLPYLGDLAARWEATRGDDALWNQAHVLAGHMLSRWPRRPPYWREGDKTADTVRMLEALTRLRDGERIETLLTLLAAREELAAGDNAAVLNALDVLPPEHAGVLLEQLISPAGSSFGARADLLARAAGARAGAIGLNAAARRLFEALPGNPAAAPRPAWGGGGLDPAGVTAMLLALDAIDPALAEKAVTRMLAWPSGPDPSGMGPVSPGMDTLLVPALRAMIEAGAPRGSAAIARLRGACLAYLRARVATPLTPPQDWRRDGKLRCKCEKCAALSRFLVDPGQEVWRLRAAAPDRNHVESTILSDRPDVGTSTEKKGSPHTLVCTKNRAGYDRLVARRNKDRQDLACLEA